MSHNRSVTASPPSALNPQGLRTTKKRSRAIRPLCDFSPPYFFTSVKIPRIFLYRKRYAIK